MLDPFSALGLASNIVQFVDFASELVSGSVELYRSADGTSKRNVELASITSDLKSISSSLKSADHDEGQIPALSKQCKTLADQLLGMLQDLAVKGRHRRWNTFQQALRGMLKDKEIRDIEGRLSQFRSQLILRLANDLNNQSSEINNQIRNLALSYDQMGVNCDFRLAELKDELLKTIKIKAQEDQESLGNLGTQLRSFMADGNKLARQENVLGSLAFKTMAVRHSRIIEPHTKTFDWIFTDSSNKSSSPTKFSLWLRQGSGIYWITGKAGSGKSTLMKYLANHDRMKENLQTWANPLKLVTSSYYFWGAGNELQKSQIGLLRSLLHDILRQCPTLIPGVWGKTMADESYFGREEINWNLPNMVDILEWLSQQRTFPVKFCFFLDGLDEYDGDPVKITNILQRLSNSPAIKLCVSSRPWTEIRSSLRVSVDQTIMLQDFTRQDIKIYIHNLLENDFHFTDRASRDVMYQQLTLDILNRARGVFLWVFLVVRSLLRGLRHEDTLSDLQKRLAHFPPDLESLFKHMLDDIEPVYHCQTAQILQMCLAAGHALPLYAFSFLDNEAQDDQYALHSKMEAWSGEQFVTNDSITRKRVHARCRDLVEISLEPRDKNQVIMVNFLHRTVRDFLLTKEMRTLLSEWAPPSFNAQRSLFQASVAWMKVLPRAVDDSRLCIEECLHYARQIEVRNTHCQLDISLIYELDDVARYHRADPMMGTTGLFGGWERGSIFILAFQAGLKSYVAYKSEHPEPLHLINKYGGQTLYFYFVRTMGSKSGMVQELDIEMLEILLKHGVDPNTSYNGSSIWLCFLKSCAEKSGSADERMKAAWAEAIRLFLKNGAAPDVTALRSASYLRRNDIESADKPYMNVIDFIRVCCPAQSKLLEEVLESKRKFNIWSLFRIRPVAWIRAFGLLFSSSALTPESEYELVGTGTRQIS
ncbi:hypothetical protein BDZ45DRAFT_183438 [Acephala macrosclerotiorum]|nr:hypothetical protein BDZ45DRAFT_183438 [Acephala macrosclerotiorum]